MPNTTWDLYVIEYARSKEQPWVDLISGMHKDGTVDLPFSFMLAMQGDRKVLIDTGFMQDEQSSGFSLKFGIPDWISPVRMLGELGVTPEEITDIVITHAHFDHMGSVGQYPNANLFIQKSELMAWYEYIALPKRFGYMTAIIDPDNLRTALEASIEHRVTLVDGDKDNILPGIHARLGPGHTPGHQFIEIETERGKLTISGDCVYSRRQILGLDNDGVYAPLNNATGDFMDQLRSIDKLNDSIEGDQKRLLLIHDSDRWEGLPVVKEIEGYKIVKAS